MLIDGPRPAPHRNNFDAIRLFAAFAVVVQHVTVHMDTTILWVEARSPWWFYDGVPLFFMISGLFVFRSAEKIHDRNIGWGAFYRNRLLRVAPAIWVYLAITLTVLILIGTLSLKEVISTPGFAWVASTMLLAPVYSPGFLADFGVGVINGSLWTIPAEVSFYVTVPALVLLATRTRKLIIAIAILVAGLMLAVIPIFVDGLLIDLYKVTFVPYLWYFAIGILWHFLTKAGVEPGRLAAIFGLLGYVATTSLAHLVGGTLQQLLTLLAAMPLSAAMIWLGQSGPRFLERLTKRVGDLSFGVYIWHMPVVNLLLWAGFGGSMVAGSVAIALTVGLGWTSWHLVEKRALRLKQVTSREQAPTDSV